MVLCQWLFDKLLLKTGAKLSLGMLGIVLSITFVHIKKGFMTSHKPLILFWYARLGSNQRLSAPEADALSTELRARSDISNGKQYIISGSKSSLMAS